jgi:tetratricopeptide (TPR) repeat protein
VSEPRPDKGGVLIFAGGTQKKFLRDYGAARQLILAGSYQVGIAAMHALGHDEHPDVANYIGYANRKLGNYEQSKIWYETALEADPNHTRTWSYYGMW